MDGIEFVTFSVEDVELLYAIPQQGADIATVVRSFMFVNRTSIPSYSALSSFLRKAINTGVVIEEAGVYFVSPKWYGRIHVHDDVTDNEIESMLAFQDSFVGEKIAIDCKSDFSFSKLDYTNLADIVLE